MKTINNIKLIRETYGATQEQIARALSVNRVTVANWENGSSKPSSANREKMSLYYGIGPEFFYERELTDDAKALIVDMANRERAVVAESNGSANKQDDFSTAFAEITFDQVMENYMITTKILLAKADDADLETLRTAVELHKKMGRRLEAYLMIREDEEI